MFKIGFCDDNNNVLQELSKWIEEYRAAYNQEIEYVMFQSSLEVLAYIEKGGCLDALFTEVLMPGLNGIKMAEELRRLDDYTKIIFLTNTREYAVESYQVRAYFYQLKPIKKMELDSLMNRLLEEHQRERKRFLVLKCKNGITSVYFHKLEYSEMVNRSLYLYLNNGTVLECNMSMEQLEKKLEDVKNFIRPHRSYLVNMEHIECLGSNHIIMKSQIQIPVPSTKRKEIKEKYLAYITKQV